MSIVSIAAVFIAGSVTVAALHAVGAARLDAARRALIEKRGGPTTPAGPRQSPHPEHLNGARWLVAGGEAVICSVEDFKFYGVLADRSTSTWSDGEMSRARRILGEQRSALKLLRAAGTMKVFDFGFDGAEANHREIDFLSVVRGLRLLVLHARIAWHDGKKVESLTALDAVARAADALLRTPVVMSSMVGSAAVRWIAWAASDVVRDPCTAANDIRHLRSILPHEDPVHCSDATLIGGVAELADAGLDYSEGRYDPSLGWSLPFWVANRFLFEDLIVADIVRRWSRQIEAGRRPAASWPPDPVARVWHSRGWPWWFAMSGDFSANLFSELARAQAAESEMRQLRAAIALRLTAPDGLGAGACGGFDPGPPLPLTGQPLVCRYDPAIDAILIEVPGGSEALVGHTSSLNRAGFLPAIALPVGEHSELCR